MKRIINFATIFATALIPMFIGCSDDSDGNNTTKPVEIPLNEQTRALVDNGNNFCCDLLNAVSQRNDDNFVISPLSIFAMNAMLANADDGISKKEILNVMGLAETSETIKNLNEYCNSMFRSLPKIDGNVTCSFANGIWADPTLKLNESFKTDLTGQFGAECREVSPSGERGLKDINNWVGLNTSGLIKDFIKEPFEDVSFAIINVVYFNGEWKEKFDKARTRTATFHNSDGTESPHMQMQFSGSTNYLATEDYEAVSLKYGNGNFEMVLILPQNDNVNLLSKTAFESMSSNFKNMMPVEIELKMPKFEIDTQLDLVETLKYLGIRAPFDSKYGLNNICRAPIFLGIYSQGVRIRVDEEGTEATAVTITGGDIMSSGKATVTFDRPFMFIIRETTTGAILFAGRINKL